MATCKLGDILRQATKAESQALELAIEDRDNWSAKELASAVNRTKYSIGVTTIKDHRRMMCLCYDN